MANNIRANDNKCEQQYLKMAKETEIKLVDFLEDLENGKWDIERESFLFKDNDAEERLNRYIREYRTSWTQNIVEYATTWAKMMQIAVKQELEVIYTAELTSLEPDDSHNIRDDSNLFRTAISLLCECWKYGDELGKWYLMTHKR